MKNYLSDAYEALPVLLSACPGTNLIPRRRADRQCHRVILWKPGGNTSAQLPYHAQGSSRRKIRVVFWPHTPI
jgi:hypothetical protein